MSLGVSAYTPSGQENAILHRFNNVAAEGAPRRLREHIRGFLPPATFHTTREKCLASAKAHAHGFSHAAPDAAAKRYTRPRMRKLKRSFSGGAGAEASELSDMRTNKACEAESSHALFHLFISELSVLSSR